jgi:hypothetical protein
MKKNRSIFLVVASAALLGSCQKASDTKPPATGGFKVKSYTEDVISQTLGNSITTYNLGYDGSDRIISVTSTTAAGDKFLFSYPAPGKYSVDIYHDNMLTIHTDAYTNSAAFIDSTFQYNDTRDSSSEKYVYNANNQLTALKEYDYSVLTGADLSNTTNYTYNGDGDKITSSDLFGNTQHFDYYPDITYSTPNITGLPNPNGAKKFHLVKKISFSFGSFSGTADYTYTFDLSDRIATEKAVASDGSTVTKTYTYF